MKTVAALLLFMFIHHSVTAQSNPAYQPASENDRHRLDRKTSSARPLAIANFTSQYAFEGDAPREWAERLYNIQRWTPMERGGHFAPAEEPVALARDIAAFFASLI